MQEDGKVVESLICAKTMLWIISGRQPLLNLHEPGLRASHGRGKPFPVYTRGCCKQQLGTKSMPQGLPCGSNVPIFGDEISNRSSE